MDMFTIKKRLFRLPHISGYRERTDRDFVKRSYICLSITQAQRKGWSLSHSLQYDSILTCCQIPAPSGRNDDPAGGIHNNLKMLSAVRVLHIYRAAT
jgi:hypothetical protein